MPVISAAIAGSGAIASQHGDQRVGEVLDAAVRDLEVEPGDELGRSAGGDQQRASDLHGRGQRVVGMRREDDIDALDLARKLAVDIEAVVRQQHHHLGPLPARGGNRSAQRLLADAERPRRHHPARVGDRRVGERLPDHGDGDAALLEHAGGGEHRLLKIGVADVAGKERNARGAGLVQSAEQLLDTLSTQRELPVTRRRLHAERLQDGDHVGAAGLQRGVGALQRVAAIEQQHALWPALGPDGRHQRGHAIHAADAAIRARQRLVVAGGEHVGFERGRRDAEARQEVGADQMRQLAERLADAEIERRLAVVDGLELRVAVSHVQERELALGREPQQVFLADGALRRSPPQP
jgi:hypothetical protein